MPSSAISGMAAGGRLLSSSTIFPVGQMALIPCVTGLPLSQELRNKKAARPSKLACRDAFEVHFMGRASRQRERAPESSEPWRLPV
jgi:hypothetical protein